MLINVNDSNFKEEVLDSPIPVLVDFWAEWCGPCRMMAPVVDQLAEEYKGRIKVCKVDVDKARETAVKYGIMSIPTLSMFKQGRMVDSVIGAVSKAALVSKLDALLG